MKVLVVLSMLMVAGRLASGAELAAGEERPRVLCGRRLAEARMLYCFNSDQKDYADTQKRSSRTPFYASLYGREAAVPWSRLASPQRALALRGKRDPGLVDECCFKPCYLSELLTYC